MQKKKKNYIHQIKVTVKLKLLKDMINKKRKKEKEKS